MHFLRRHKMVFGVLSTIVVVLFFVLPLIGGVVLRGRAETMIQETTNAPVKLGGLTIRFLPPGVTLSKLEIGNPDPAAGNQPLLRADSIRADVPVGMIFGGAMRLTFLSLSGLALNVSVDENGESSLNRFRQGMKGMKGARETELSIDSLVLENLHVSSYVDRSLMRFAPPAGQADGTLTVKVARVQNLVLPPQGKLLGREVWIQAELEGVICTAPRQEAPEPPEGSVPDGASVKRVTAEVVQAPVVGAPTKVRDIEIQGLECATVYKAKGLPPALPRAIAALFFGMVGVEPEGADRSPGEPKNLGSAGIQVESFSLRPSRYEIRGPDISGRNAFWRLTDLSADGTNLAMGPTVATPKHGQLRIESASESSSGPGHLLLEVTHLTGGYPKSSFNVHYRVDGIAGPPFTVASMAANGPGIISGQISAAFDGHCSEGELAVDGSLTLSPDFMVDAAMAQLLTGLQASMPIETIRLRGTLDQPELLWPGAMAGALGNAMEMILLHGTIGGIKTTGVFVGTVLKQGVRGTGNTVKRVGGAFGRFMQGVFSED